METGSASPVDFDVAVIGGGINGCGIARDAAGRGLSVYLCEMGDLASATSSCSTKLIHGGLRYLEHYEFRLVREALIEREILWGIAPHLIRPMRFVLPHRRGMRPAWLLRLGLELYDNLGGRKQLAGTLRLDLTRDAAGGPLKPEVFSRGFEYSDCTVDDARLVVLTAVDARRLGAAIETRTRATRARRTGKYWEIDVEPMGPVQARGQARATIRAKALVNAAGPWVETVLAEVIGSKPRAKVRLVQGSHVVVRRLFEHDRAYILQNADRRIVFAIPWLDDFTLIGTTDCDYAGDPARVSATAEEIAYLCAAVGRDFRRAVGPEDVVWSFAGVRPLYDDGASDAKAATRDYVLEVDAGGPDAPPLLSVFGGKITTYRRLAEEALDKLATRIEPKLASKLVTRQGWTGKSALPGGDFPVNGHGVLEREFNAAYPFLSAGDVRRMVAAYGTGARKWLGSALTLADLGRHFGAGLTEAEVAYLMADEWAETADDVLWRRSKLGLRLSEAEAATLDEWMADARARTATS